MFTFEVVDIIEGDVSSVIPSTTTPTFLNSESYKLKQQYLDTIDSNRWL